MNPKILLIAALVLFSLSCGQNNRKADKEQTAAVEGFSEAGMDNKTFTSLIRPGEQLLAGKIYTDSDFEYVEYNDRSDYFFFVVKKNGERMILLDDCPAGTAFPVWNKGDIVEIQWKIDSSWVAGDGETLEMTEWATNIKKTKDGNLSLFKKKYHKKTLTYYIAGEPNEDNKFSNYFLDRIYRQVEYYLANSKQQTVQSALGDPSANIGYSIDKQERDGKSYYVIGIYNDFENRTNTFQWLYLSDDAEKVLEDTKAKYHVLNELNDVNIFWDAINFNRTSTRLQIIEDVHYQKDSKLSVVYIRLKELFPFYMEYCNHIRVRSVDYITLRNLITSESYPAFIKNTTSRGGNAYIKKGFYSSYRFTYTLSEECDGIIISGKLVDL